MTTASEAQTALIAEAEATRAARGAAVPPPTPYSAPHAGPPTQVATGQPGTTAPHNTGVPPNPYAGESGGSGVSPSASSPGSGRPPAGSTGEPAGRRPTPAIPSTDASPIDPQGSNTAGGGPGTAIVPYDAAAARAASVGRSGRIQYGSTDLSQEAMAYATREGIGDGTNVAVFEYVDDEGNLRTIARASRRGVGHSESLAARELRARGVPNDRVLRIYSDLEPCHAPGGYCATMISDGARRSGLGPFPNAEVSYSFPYGGNPHDPNAAAAGVEALRAARRQLRGN